MANDATATLYVKTVAQGVDAAARQLGEMARATARAGAEYKTLDTNLRKDPFAPLTQSLAQVGRIGQQTFGMLAGSVGGFITAGMQGTAEAIQLRRALAEISLQAASVFAPWIHKAIDLLQRLAQTMRGLTGDTQKQIREWVAGTLAVSGFLALLGGKGLPGLGRLPLVGGMLGSPLGAAAGALAMTPEGRKALTELYKAAVPLAQAFARLAPIVAAIGTAFAKVITWIMEHLPGGEGGETAFTGLATVAGGIAGARYGGHVGATAGAIVANRVAHAAEEAVGGGDVRRLAAEGGGAAVQSVEEARRQLAAFKAELAAGVAGDRAEKLRGYIQQLEAGLAPKAGKEALTPFTPGFEAVTDLYRRIAEAASADTMKSDAAQTAENTARIRELLETMPPQMAEMARRLFPDLDRPGDS